jgi:hypothetical protein
MLIIATVLIPMAVAPGCWRYEASGPSPPSRAARKALDANEQKAVDAAAAMLKAQGVDYGTFESIKLSEDKKTYWIEYATTEHEIKVLGPRAVKVEAGTWKAELVMRD